MELSKVSPELPEVPGGTFASHVEAMDRLEPIEVLIAFFDLAGYSKALEGMKEGEAGSVMVLLNELVGDTVEAAGGKVVKFIGDGGLVVFPKEMIHQGVRALRELKVLTDQWLIERGWHCWIVVKVHVGRVYGGPMGTRRDKRFDVIGKEVNATARLKSRGFAMTVQTFERLDAETKKQFIKDPLVPRYVPVEDMKGSL